MKPEELAAISFIVLVVAVVAWLVYSEVEACAKTECWNQNYTSLDSGRGVEVENVPIAYEVVRYENGTVEEFYNGVRK